MSDPVNNENTGLVANVGDPEQFKYHFDSIIGDKMRDALQDLRIQIAQQMFGSHQE